MQNRFRDTLSLVQTLTPVRPVLCLRPGAARSQAKSTIRNFAGAVAYAVKSCDEPVVLAGLRDGGVRHWDIASVAEGQAVRAIAPDGVLHFMNPVKPREAIREAHGMGVRTFAFDHPDELAKILFETSGNPDVLPVLRLGVDRGRAKLCLGGKFGAPPDLAVEMLKQAARGFTLTGRSGGAGAVPTEPRDTARPVGITFHVGSQCEHPEAFTDATRLSLDIAERAGVVPSLIDIGGGFPAPYQGHEPDFSSCTQGALRLIRERIPGFAGSIQCEPGRLLSAPCASVIVRVELRRGDQLFLNDGIFGLLGELKYLPGSHPVRALQFAHPKARDRGERPLQPYDLFGPTCDSMDSMPGPYFLPGDIAEGDWIEVGLAGAYSTCFKTRFNGLGLYDQVILED